MGFKTCKQWRTKITCHLREQGTHRTFANKVALIIRLRFTFENNEPHIMFIETAYTTMMHPVSDYNGMLNMNNSCSDDRYKHEVCFNALNMNMSKT